MVNFSEGDHVIAIPLNGDEKWFGKVKHADERFVQCWIWISSHLKNTMVGTSFPVSICVPGTFHFEVDINADKRV